MDIFDFYRNNEQRSELKRIFEQAAQYHPDGLGEAFIEKDIWVTELLRLLFDEDLLDGKTVAFKGGTALSKRWKAIDRFSEDIDLSIHWHEMLEKPNTEIKDWDETNISRSQRDKFRKNQERRLKEWTTDFAARLEKRLKKYNIDGLGLKLRNHEQIEVYYPVVTEQDNQYHLGPVLLEFGARNRGKPTESSTLSTYLSEIPLFADLLSLPLAEKVKVFDPSYIIWEKLTALHQFCTADKEQNAARLARHWYDVDCMMCRKIVDPLQTPHAMNDVIDMKKARWSVKGVDFEQVSCGGLDIIPKEPLRSQIINDFKDMVSGGMYFKTPDNFTDILARLEVLQNQLNQSLVKD
jgi:hypothetical protein